jgi:hypothetical protein
MVLSFQSDDISGPARLCDTKTLLRKYLMRVARWQRQHKECQHVLVAVWPRLYFSAHTRTHAHTHLYTHMNDVVSWPGRGGTSLHHFAWPSVVLSAWNVVLSPVLPYVTHEDKEHVLYLALFIDTWQQISICCIKFDTKICSYKGHFQRNEWLFKKAITLQTHTCIKTQFNSWEADTCSAGQKFLTFL